MLPEAFHKRIQTAINDPNLQAALDANAERRLNARQKAYESLPQPWEIMRKRAKAVRAEVITNLEAYLEQFIKNAKANSMIIHQAASALVAIEIILNIAQEKNARLIAKSKTMVSEEIGLNHALEKAGLQAVETDLGEYIIQLRGEPPAHIITPAVHLRRAEVGQTFHEKLGIPLTVDIPTLTEAARKTLRQVFLAADIGLSGVNFGVAESGTICIVTNEGNGRMVTTLPPVHIALMGIERLVPTYDDLALMLYLLPRSATGQKLSVYTNLINGPSLTTPHGGQLEADGPPERHLILVDNGRTALRRSPLSEVLSCIRCGACLNACPVFREIGGHAYVNLTDVSSTYPGPIGSIVSPGLFGQAEFGHLARASSLCGACREACPVDIDLPKLLLRVRAGMTPGIDLSDTNPKPVPNTPQTLSWGLKLYTWLASSPSRFSLAQKIIAAVGRLSPHWWRLPALTGWGLSKDFPRPARLAFRERWNVLSQSSLANSPANNHSVSTNQNEIQAQDERSKFPLPRTFQNREDLMNTFAGELTALGGTFIHSDQSELTQRMINLLEERGITRILAWDDTLLPLGLADTLRQAGIELQTGSQNFHSQNEDEDQSQTKAGLTGAIAAIAETGSLVLASGSGRPMTTSLLTEVHIAILNCSDIHPSLYDAFRIIRTLSASNIVLITGPSRTADIEMTLTIGVHGPKELIVFCLDE